MDRRLTGLAGLSLPASSPFEDRFIKRSALKLLDLCGFGRSPWSLVDNLSLELDRLLLLRRLSDSLLLSLGFNPPLLILLDLLSPDSLPEDLLPRIFVSLVIP